MRFSVTYRDVKASRQTGPSADVAAADEFTEEIDAKDAVDAAKVIQEQPGRRPGGIDILSVRPLDDNSAGASQ
jgi:hypothetical protein